MLDGLYRLFNENGKYLGWCEDVAADELAFVPTQMSSMYPGRILYLAGVYDDKRIKVRLTKMVPRWRSLGAVDQNQWGWAFKKLEAYTPENFPYKEKVEAARARRSSILTRLAGTFQKLVRRRALEV